MRRRRTWRGGHAPAQLRRLVNELRTRRLALGVSQREVAEAAHMAQSQVSDIETVAAEPRLSTLAAYAYVLGYSVRITLRRRETK